MKRRDLLWGALAAGCGRAPKPVAKVFPAEVSGCRLGRVEGLALSSVDGDLRRLGAREAARAFYQGGAMVEVTLYDMTNRKSAYAALRLAREAPERVPFYRDGYFGVAQSAQAGHDALAAFARELAGKL